MSIHHLFEIKYCVIYAQEGIVDHRSISRTPSGIYFQSEVRPAVQSILNIYCDNYGWKGCGHVKAFSISDIANRFFDKGTRETLKEVLEEAKKRGYDPPNIKTEFDAVLTAVHVKKDAGTPPFDLDRILGEFYLQRYDTKNPL